MTSGVHTLHTRTTLGLAQTHPLEKVLREGLSAYMDRRPPDLHVVNVEPPAAGLALYLLTSNGNGVYAVQTATVHAATNRAIFNRGQTPTLYPIFATPSHSEAMNRMTEYRHAHREARKAATAQPQEP